MSKCCLYRHFDAQGNLLYVGISRNAAARLRGHKIASWYDDISSITIEHLRRNPPPLTPSGGPFRANTPSSTSCGIRARLLRMPMRRLRGKCARPHRINYTPPGAPSWPSVGPSKSAATFYNPGAIHMPQIEMRKGFDGFVIDKPLDEVEITEQEGGK